MNEIEYEKGYEDIAAASPYIDWEIDGDRALIHLVYVPPSQRGKGIGKQLFQSVLDAIKPPVSGLLSPLNNHYF